MGALELPSVPATIPPMTTLSDIRTMVRRDLHDTDDSAYRWDDDQLDRHIAHALADLSRHTPQELSANVETTAGSRDLSLADLDGLLEVERVEYPLDWYPPSLAPFERWGQTLTLRVDRAPTGGDARVFYTAAHVLDESSSTVPPEMESTLAMGAAAFAVLERAALTAESLNTGGETVPAHLTAWARAREVAFRQLLLAGSRCRRVRRVRPVRRG